MKSYDITQERREETLDALKRKTASPLATMQVSGITTLTIANNREEAISLLNKPGFYSIEEMEGAFLIGKLADAAETTPG